MISAMIGTNSRKYRQALSRTIKALRGQRTQREVANKAGIPTSTWCKIEQGRQLPRDTTFERIADALGCTVGQLEQLVSESTWEEIERDRRMATRKGSTTVVLEGGEGPIEIDLSGLPPVAARRLSNVLSGVEVIRNHLDSLELDLLSLARELQNFSEFNEGPSPKKSAVIKKRQER